MTDKLKQFNKNINNLRLILRSTSDKSSVLELTDMVHDTKNARAFIFLLDRFDTDKELTREVLEDLIENTHNFNSTVVDHLEVVSKEKAFNINNYVNTSNAKSWIIAAIIAGVLIAVATSPTLVTGILEYAGVKVSKVSKDNNESN